MRGDGLVLVSLVLSAAFTVAQGRLLPGRDPVAVTAVQFLGAALGALPVTVLSEGAPAGQPAPVRCWPWPRWRWPARWRRSRCSPTGRAGCRPQVAGAFLNLEPLVGAMAGIMFFGDPAGPRQLAGGLAVVAGIGLSAGLLPGAQPRPAGRRRGQARESVAPAAQSRAGSAGSGAQ